MSKVGIQLLPQHSSIEDIQEMWARADVHLDSIWMTDHLFPQWGPPDGNIFECWTLLAALAVLSTRAAIGSLVSCAGLRNSRITAEMARTVSQLASGRFTLGLGAGWNPQDFEACGLPFESGRQRADAFETAISHITATLPRLQPVSRGAIPLLIAASGERMLKTTARYANLWNGSGPLEAWSIRSAMIDRACVESGRNPAEIERTVSILHPLELADLDGFLLHGASHFILMCDRENFDFVLGEAQHLRKQISGEG